MLISLFCVAAGDAGENYTVTVDVPTDVIIDGPVFPIPVESDDSFDDLQSEIDNTSENDVLDLNKNYTSKGSDIVISNPITINGNNHVVDFNYLNSRIIIKADNVVFNNIKFINGKTDSESNIVWSGNNAQINNCVFENNEGFWGGALYLTGNNVNIDDCLFINNKAYWGGALYHEYSSKFTMKNSQFIANQADCGGACYLSGYNLKKYNVDIDNCKFINNAADSSGALDIGFATYSKITNSYFYNNTAIYGCGAVYINGYKNTIKSCDFIKNTADYIGALEFQSSFSTIENSNFIENKAIGDDFGAVIVNGEHSKIINSNFILNSAERIAGAVAICNMFNYIYNSSFISNSAESGGAVYWDGNNGIIKGCYFENNSAVEGGAIFMIDNNVKIEDSQFINNTAVYGNDICSLCDLVDYNETFYGNASSDEEDIFEDTYGDDYESLDDEDSEDISDDFDDEDNFYVEDEESIIYYIFDYYMEDEITYITLYPSDIEEVSYEDE